MKWVWASARYLAFGRTPGHRRLAKCDAGSFVGTSSISTAIAALPNEQQEVLLLRYGQDLKVGEIAEILGLSRFQVMYRVRGALRQLKKLLKEESP